MDSNQEEIMGLLPEEVAVLRPVVITSTEGVKDLTYKVLKFRIETDQLCAPAHYINEFTAIVEIYQKHKITQNGEGK